MKKVLLSLFLGTFIITMLGCSSQKASVSSNPENEAAIRALAERRIFAIDVKETEAYTPLATFLPCSVAVSGNTITTYLPYVGDNMLGHADGCVPMRGTISKYSVREKKDGMYVTVEFRDDNDYADYKFLICMFFNGKSYIEIEENTVLGTGSKRLIRFNGDIRNVTKTVNY